MPTNHQLATHLFLQLAVLLIASQSMGKLLKNIGQTQVVSEMITGVVLGPSCLGLLAPGWQSFLFPTTLVLTVEGAVKIIPHPSMMLLLGLSQLGLVLYMFMIGLEFNTELLFKHWKSAGTISLSGVIAPLIMGGGLGLHLAAKEELFTSIVAPWQASLFMGAAMLITAFPMLARIIYESRISNTKIGTLALSAAAFDDAIAWIILAIVVATAKNSPLTIALAIGGGAIYFLSMAFLRKPLFNLFKRVNITDAEFHEQPFILLMLILMVCASFTDTVGIYSIFGAFIAGTMMPRCEFIHDVRRKIEPLTVTLLLPIFLSIRGLILTSIF